MPNKPKSSSDYFYKMMSESNLRERNYQLYEELLRIKGENFNGKGLPLQMGRTLKGVEDKYGNDYILPLLATIFFIAIFVALVTLAAMNPIGGLITGGLIIGAIVCLLPLLICLYKTFEELAKCDREMSQVSYLQEASDLKLVKDQPERMVSLFEYWILHGDDVLGAAPRLWETTCDQQLDDALIYEILGRIKYKNDGYKTYSKESIKKYCNRIPFDLSDRINRILEIIEPKGDLGKIRYSPLRDLIYREGSRDNRKDVISRLGEMRTIFESSNQARRMVESGSILDAGNPSGEVPGVTTPSRQSQAMPAPPPETPESIKNAIR